MGDDGNLLVALGLEKRDRLGNALGGLGEGRRVGFAPGVGGEDRHLDRQGGKAAVGQFGAQGADHAPVGVDAHAVDDDGRLAGVRRGKQREELVVAARRLQVDRIAHHQPGHDFIRPFFLARIIRHRLGKRRQ